VTIKNICIENTRGIDLLTINADILKNRPNILVAPNGFGKTSIAAAFRNAAHQTFIKICDGDRHQHDETRKSKIKLELEEDGTLSKLSASEDAHSNDIRKNFDIHVISDLRRIKAQSRNFGGFSRAEAKMIIDPIVICNKTTRVASPYRISEAKRAFGAHNVLLPNIDDELFRSHEFIMRSPEIFQYINSLVKTRKWSQIEKVRQQISDFDGDTTEALENAQSSIVELCRNMQEARGALTIVTQTTKLNQAEAFLALWQMLLVARSNSDTLKSHLEWLRYSAIKQSLRDGLNDLNTSWKIPSLKETKGKLIVEMPDPTHISNGQRDVMVLLSLLHIARHNLTKSRAIVIIDEVFDYLDDANLTVAQYYISQLIEDYKRQGRSIYTIILTHLNPAFFRNYVFSNQNTVYLDKGSAFDSIDAMKKLIGARSQTGCDEELKNKISKYLVHYHVDEYDFSDDLKVISGVRSSWGKHGRFQKFLTEEFNKYETGQQYDPLAICAITRRSIEELAYRQISEHPDSEEFFTTHKTGPKLDWASQRGASVPESHYLLRVIFDDGLHWNHNRDNTISIVAKLANPIIKKMISDVVHQCNG
tara:strand:+ start:7287 stop:9059 length:1773 start_codon:yes stop_codon:yes gene_type:complete